MNRIIKASTLILIVIIFIVSSISFSQETKSIAVLELNPANISLPDAQILTDRLRVELFKTGKFIVLERDKMEDILKEQGFQQTGCTTNECAVEIGRLIGIKQMIAGNIGKIGNIYTLSARLIDVETGSVILTATEDCKCDIETVLMQSIKKVALSLTNIAPPKDTVKIKTITFDTTSIGIIDTISIDINDKNKIKYAEHFLEQGRIDDANKTYIYLITTTENNNTKYYVYYKIIDFASILLEQDKTDYANKTVINLLNNIESSETLTPIYFKICDFAENLYLKQEYLKSYKILDYLYTKSKGYKLISKVIYLKILNSIQISRHKVGWETETYKDIEILIKDYDSHIYVFKIIELFWKLKKDRAIKFALNSIIEKSKNHDDIAKALFTKIKLDIEDPKKDYEKLKLLYPDSPYTIEAVKIMETNKSE